MFVVPMASWLLKREVVWIPIVGWAVSTLQTDRHQPQRRALGREPGDRAGPARLAGRQGIVVYPEGTRMLPGEPASTASAARCSCDADRRAGGADRPQLWLLLEAPRVDEVPGHDPRGDRPGHRPTGMDPRQLNAQVQQWIEAKVAEIVAQPGGQPD